jgi:hypothetical protein
MPGGEERLPLFWEISNPALHGRPHNCNAKKEAALLTIGSLAG